MPIYIVTFEHPDEAGWRQQLLPHIAWLRERVADGSVLASGPLPGTEPRSALLVVRAPDLDAADALIAGDPFATAGLIENMTKREWDPIFGAFNRLSTMPTAPGDG